MRLQPFALVCLFAILAAAAPAEDLRKIAEANEQGIVHALKIKDVGWFQKIAASDYYEQELDGKRTPAKASLAMLKQMFETSNITDMSVKVLKVTRRHGGIVVRAQSHTEMTMQSKAATKPSVMVDDSTYNEFWTKEGGQWKLHWLKTVTDKYTVDGKPMKGGM